MYGGDRDGRMLRHGRSSAYGRRLDPRHPVRLRIRERRRSASGDPFHDGGSFANHGHLVRRPARCPLEIPGSDSSARISRPGNGHTRGPAATGRPRHSRGYATGTHCGRSDEPR